MIVNQLDGLITFANGELLMRATVIIVVAAFGLLGCDYNKLADYNPKSDYVAYLEAKKEAEAKLANSVPKGAIDRGRGTGSGKEEVQHLRASGYGTDGAANSGAALAMNPKPRNLKIQMAGIGHR